MVRFDLPWDLVEEILYRAPTISLGNLKFTCKRWNALFKDPEFIKKNMELGVNQNSVIMFNNFKIYSLSINLNKVHNSSINFSRSLSKSEQVDIYQVFHCNGLLLCSMKEADKPKLVVVNPCTSQTRWIKPIYHMHDRYALGYEKNNNKSSYKILRFWYDSNQLEILDLKSNSWRVLDDTPPKEDLCTYGRGVSLKGNTYWISSLLSKFDILSFDFTRERFIRLPLPFQKLPLNNIALSVVRDEKLLLLHSRSYRQLMEIWVSNKIDDTEISWSKSFTLCLRGKFDNTFLNSVSFLIDEEKKVVVCCGRNGRCRKNMIYIFGKHGRCRKFDYDPNQSNSCWPFFFSYVPSLVRV
ncbi:F-box/LRR-repeat/kelch-repeat protein [Cardamine amara subsp. amara]|uniref:F-box/LRR-repeat/kelch-repeat protein n=1 Tax=Cardamine amara subsp. amara TaxID=228776 RepID=A0ABD1AZ44_CARAN